MNKTREALRREAEAIKDTAEEVQGLTPVTGTIKQNADVVYSLRFTRNEMTQLRAAAEVRGMKVSELIREGALSAAARAHGQPSEREAALQKARQFVDAAAQALEQA